MPYCRTCGLTMSDSATFCPTCGTLVNAPPPETPAQPSPPVSPVASPSPQTVNPPPQLQSTPTPSGGPRPIAILVGVCIVVLVIIVWAAFSKSGKTTEGPSGTTNAAAPGVMTVVFTWPGGGPGNDIRNSQPFTLNGGHQRVSISSQAIPTQFNMASLGWTLESADGGGQMEMINPANFGESQSDLYLPAGSYYLSSNTIDCTWTVTVSEER